MADTKITGLTVGVPVGTDVIPYVSDPGGSPVTKKTLVSSLGSTVAQENNAGDIFRVDSPGFTSVFVALLNGDPTNVANSVCTFDTVTAGGVAVITPTSTTQIGKMMIHNTTRGTSALILSATGVTFTTTTNVYTLGWRNNDVITIQDPTINSSEFVSIEITSGPMSKSAIFMYVSASASAATGSYFLAPYEAVSSAKNQSIAQQVANIGVTYFGLLKITSNRFGLRWSGTSVTVLVLREMGYIE
jgi:hypothetical protein